MLTLRTIVATSAGLTLASSSFVAAVQVAGFLAGDSAWLAILVGGLLCLAAGACFSELNGMLPSAAGIRLYFGRAFGEKTALTVSLLYMMVIMGVVGAESFILASILNHALPSVDPLVWIVVMLVTVTLMNIRGIKIAGAFQDVITYGLMISIVVLSILGLKKIDFQLSAPLAAGGIENFFTAVAVGIFLFVGFEWVTPLAEEVTDSKLISRGMFIAVGVLSVVYSLFTVTMAACVSREELAGSPVPQLLFARSILGDTGVAWIVVISLAASITTFNAGLISVSRFFYATAREHALPAVFSRVSPRYLTPWVSILAVFAVGLALSIIIMLTGKYLVLVNMAAAAESMVYAMAGVSVLILRKKLKDRERKFTIPWGSVVPVLTTAVFSLLAVGVFMEDPYAALFIAAGLAVTCWYVVRVVPALKQRGRAGRAGKRRPGMPAGAAPGGTAAETGPEKI